MTDDSVLKQRFKARMDKEFEPVLQGSVSLSLSEQTLMRIAHAADYSAYHIGRMNENIEKLINLLEKKEP